MLISCWQIILGKLTVGMYYSFNSYASRFSALVQELITFQAQFVVIMVSVDKIMCFLQEDLHKPQSLKKRIDVPVQSLEVKNLKFKYKDMEKDVLNDVNFRVTLPSFQMIVGHNGSGKSTLLDMLMNYYVPYEGSILINNVDIRELEAENLDRKIVYIRQKPFFFNMSILENFRLIDEQINFDDVSRVCEIVGMHEYIMSLPKQYDTELGEDGTHFSGGQIQCLAIARGLILNADIYLLDEVTSDLDGENEQRIMKILRSINKIVIFVTHRLSEIEPSDEILVLDEGRVIAEGRGEDLEKSCQIYRNLSGI